MVQALRDGFLLSLVLNLLLHAVVEHAEAEEIDGNANEAQDDYEDKEPCLQVVKAFLRAVKVVDHSFVVQALLGNVFGQPVRPDRYDDDSNQHGKDIQN